MSRKLGECIPHLVKAGIAVEDAQRLRRIAITLDRWHELECGTERGGIERDETTGAVTWYDSMTGRRQPFRDLETPALKRLEETMKRYPQLAYYIQGDPRGCALYILRPGDVPEGEPACAYYNRGIAVYR